MKRSAKKGPGVFCAEHPMLLCEVATLLCVARYAGRRRKGYFATKHERAVPAKDSRTLFGPKGLDSLAGEG